jgi:hypothetical protein
LPGMNVFSLLRLNPKKASLIHKKKSFTGAYGCPPCRHSYQANDEGKSNIINDYMFNIFTNINKI